MTVILFLPAYLGNGAPVVFKGFGWLKFLARPLDGGVKWGKGRILGENKTFRGVVAAILAGSIGGIISVAVYNYLPAYFGDPLGKLHGQTVLYGLYFGSLIGFGGILGDALKSFFKRRTGIKEGKPWFPFDQTDFVMGGWLFSGVFLPWQSTWQLLLLALLITPPVHFLFNVLAYKIGWKKVWW